MENPIQKLGSDLSKTDTYRLTKDNIAPIQVIMKTAKKNIPIRISSQAISVLVLSSGSC